MPPLSSWHPLSPTTPFSLHNIPFGIITHARASAPRPAIAIGDHALDLQLFAHRSGFRHCSPIQPHQAVFSTPTLNAFAALGRPLHAVVRKYLQSLFLTDTPYPDVLRDAPTVRNECLIPLDDVTNHLPMQIGDYTDFYVGLNHAVNCGILFRGPQEALSPSYRHLPVAYHGRASSVVVSGSPVVRPKGQIIENITTKELKPIFGPCQRLDFELELGCFLCKPTQLSESIPVDKAHEHLFGMVLLNDWSARDFQAWEMAPLGPFTAKNFCTTVSPWIVLMDALEPFRTQGIVNEIENLPYLRESEKRNVHNIRLEVSIQAEVGEENIVTKTNGKHLLFSWPQMLAHHTAGGCNVNVGDLLGSGTVSSAGDKGGFGSLFEQTENKKNAVKLQHGGERMFLEDWDRVRFTGFCGEEGALVGFGDCVGHIVPSRT